MNIIVNDTNIFIDLHSLGMLDELFKLPYEIHTVDLVIAEITNPTQAEGIGNFIERGLIHVHSFTDTEIGEIANEHSKVSNNLSFQDISVCYYARKSNYSLITGDRRLRKYAEQANVEVHGILFLLDEMIVHNIISPETGIRKLKQLIYINIRLPKSEIELRIKDWSKEASK